MTFRDYITSIRVGDETWYEVNGNRYTSYTDAKNAKNSQKNVAVADEYIKAALKQHLDDLNKSKEEMEEVFERAKKSILSEDNSTNEITLSDEQMKFLMDILLVWDKLDGVNGIVKLSTIRGIILECKYTQEQKGILNKLRKIYKNYLKDKEENKPQSKPKEHGYTTKK